MGNTAYQGVKSVRVAAALVGVVAVLVASCSDLERGVVTDKKHFDEYSSVVSVPTGKGGITFVPQYQPERWVLYLRDGDRSGEHEVSRDEFDKYQVNDPYP